ncbi:MAG: hypothetical protein HZB61_11925 [Nitrospirae bacterium]|nr:hypothetical protein [Nitrospirota bacterium]
MFTDLDKIVQSGVDYSRNNPAAAIIIIVVVIYLIFRRPKFFFSVMFIVLCTFGLLKILSKLSMLGLEHNKIPFIE